jgi:hypothetical protein
VGRTRVIESTYERFDITIDMPEPLDRIGKRPAGDRVFVE